MQKGLELGGSPPPFLPATAHPVHSVPSYSSVHVCIFSHWGQALCFNVIFDLLSSCSLYDFLSGALC